MLALGAVARRLKIGPYGKAALALIALATVVRVALTALVLPEANSDEGAMGLEAMHIAFQGQHPIYLYGQNYMGALEAYLGALFFRLVGTSVFTLRLGLIVMLALFLGCLYLLTSLLYTKKLALFTLALLCLPATDVVIQQLRAVGGAVETLLFGTLILLLATWLALTADRASMAPVRARRWAAYAGMGLATGVGLWVHVLVAPFVLMGIVLVMIFCRRELTRSRAVPLFLVGCVAGGLPLILYTLHAPPGQNPLDLALSLQSGNGLPHGADLLAKQFAGTFLWSLPLATGLSPICAVTEVPLYGPVDAHTLPCVLVQGTWSLGYVLLLAAAVLLAVLEMRACLGARRAAPPPSTARRRALVIQVARLALLLSALIPLALYLQSPLSGLKPWSTRYLIGLLPAIPAVLWPLWQGARIEGVRLPAALQRRRSRRPALRRGISASAPFVAPSVALASLLAPRVPPASSPAPRLASSAAVRRARSMSALQATDSKQGGGKRLALPFSRARNAICVVAQRALLAAVTAGILASGIATLATIPSTEADNAHQQALIKDLERIGATRIYLEYWTCYRLMLQSQERIICAIPPGGLQSPGTNRYLPYLAMVQADPLAAHVFPQGSPDALAFARAATRSSVKYRMRSFDGYVVFQPEVT